MIRAAAEAIIGRGHEASAGVCQDRVLVRNNPNQRYGMVALADGAGSARLSDMGAELVVKQICRLVRKHADKIAQSHDKASMLIVRDLQNSLARLAAQQKCQLDDLASTLLFAYIEQEELETRCILGHIGDGILLRYTPAGITLVSGPENGEFANQTYFVTQSQAGSRLRLLVDKVEGDVGFLLASDGAAESSNDKRRKTPAPGCQLLFNWMQEQKPNEFKKSLSASLREAIREMTHDDCSVAILRTVQFK